MAMVLKDAWIWRSGRLDRPFWQGTDYPSGAPSCLLTRDHLLFTDARSFVDRITTCRGIGKTTLTHALARYLSLQYRCIQFTSDLLPADILSAAVYEHQRETLCFIPSRFSLN